MNERERKFVRQGIVIPVIVAVIITALAFIIYSASSGTFLFKERSFVLAEYSESDVSTMDNYSPQGSEILKSELPSPGGNTVIGNASIGDSSFEIINAANETNGADRLCTDVRNGYTGEAGGAFLSCAKKNAAVLRMLEVGSNIELEMYYGSYEYRVADTKIVDENELYKAANEYSAAVVFYTDASTGVGVGSEYYAVVCERVNGSVIKG